MKNLLYYPYINVPKTDWTNRTLLYYDTISCIVPTRFNEQPERYENHMRDLIRENLVIPVSPMEVLNNPWDIVKPFIDYVESKEFNLKRRRKKFQNGKTGRIHSDKFNTKGPQIHIEKFDREVFYRLEQAGLAEKNGEEWYNIEKATANELMAYISTIISEKLDCQPMSDKMGRYYPYSKISRKDFKELKIRQTKRRIILDDLIPFPEEIDFTKLRRFKENHSDLLEGFRNRVELLVLDQNLEIESDLFNEKVKELILRKNELSAKMNESQFGKIFFGSICGAASAIIGFATGFGILGTPAFANAIHSALQYESPEKVFDQTGLKYMALLDKRLRIPVANTVYN
ncbi:kinase [Tenacibaculum insulae]|uniref:kinase n=1 Tax=Tenacibaculum insulae TaxID=2029677 RepID=UPI003AB1CB90